MISVANIEKFITDAIQNEFGVEKHVNVNAPLESLKDFGVDSLGLVQMVCEIEDHYRISVPNDLIFSDGMTIQKLSEQIFQLSQKSYG